MQIFRAARVRSLLGLILLMSAGIVPATFAQQNTVPTARPNQPIQVSLQSDVPVRGDFQLGPTRIQQTMDPGEQITLQLEVTNREGKPSTYSISMEDFSSGLTEGEITHLYGEQDGPFPARRWLSPAATEFTINHGERAFIPVTIKVPLDAEPGDHYAAVMVQRRGQGQGPGISVISRVGSLFIVTVTGDIIREGELMSLRSKKALYWNYPAEFILTAKDTGTMHMAPAGTIKIRNILGLMVDEIPVKDWIVLRNSQRTLDLSWQPRFALGRYTAETNLTIFENRPTAILRTSFWVIPLLPVLLALLAIFLVSFIVQFFFSRFEIKRK